MKFTAEELDTADEKLDLGGDAGGPQSMSLMGGVARPEGIEEAADLDFHSLGDGSKLMSRGTLLIVLIVLIAAGSLYAMRLAQGDGAQDETIRKNEAKIDQLLLGLKDPANAGQESPADALNDTKVILEVLDHDPADAQVPVEFTKQNPFELMLPQKAAADNAGNPAVRPAVDPAVVARQRLLKRAGEEFKKLKIQSVVPSGARPVAIIDNKIVQVGGTIGQFEHEGAKYAFTVKSIQNVSVVLEAAGETFTLSLSDK